MSSFVNGSPLPHNGADTKNGAEPRPFDWDPAWQDELIALGGLPAALVNCARMVATCSADIVGAIEGVAWAVDQERRGTMSVGYRQDQTAVAQMIRDLLQDPLLSPENRLELRRQIAKAVMDEPADAKPARAPLPRRNRQRSPKR